MKNNLVWKVIAGAALLGTLAVGNMAAEPHNNPVDFSGKRTKTELAIPALSNDPEIKPNINLDFNYLASKKLPENPVYISPKVFLNTSRESMYRLDKIQGMIKTGDIKNYSQFIDNFKDLPENDQIDLLTLLSSSLYNSKGPLDLHVRRSQQEMLDYWKTSLLGRESSQSFGACPQVSLAIARIEKDSGHKSFIVGYLSGDNIWHAVPVEKIGNGFAVADAGNILKAENTSDPEEVVRQYETLTRAVPFMNYFYDSSGKFRYMSITPEGWQFLNFLGYDPTSKPLENLLIEDQKNNNPAFNINLGNKGFSIGLENIFGVNMGLGELVFPDQHKVMPLARLGLDIPVYLGNFLRIGPHASTFFGEIMNATEGSSIMPSPKKSFIPGNVFGWNAGLSVSTTRKKGFNTGGNFSISYPLISSPYNPGSKNVSVFYDLNTSIGASYIFDLKKLTVIPYLLAQGALLPSDIITQKNVPTLESITSGIRLSSEKGNISLKPYFTWKPWEYGAGLDAKVGNKTRGIEADGEITKSAYWVNPDKAELKLGMNLNLGIFKLKGTYGLKIRSYSGYDTIQNSFNLSGDVKLGS